MGAASSTQNKYNEYVPSHSEDVATGVIGILLFLVLTIVAAFGVLIWKIENPTNKFFFATIFLMGICEQPRYWSLAITGSYTSQGAYGMHLLASIFFFLSFSLVAYQWAGILSMASIFESVVSPKGLFILNAFFGLFDLISACLCWTSKNLLDYFASDFFLLVTFIDTSKNLLFSITLMYFGLKLLFRFQNYTARRSSITTTRASARSKSDSMNISGIGTGQSPSGRNLLQNGIMQSDSLSHNIGTSDRSIEFFTKALNRITIVLTLSTFCFVLRVIMLICKISALHEDTTVSSPTFPIFGFGWFLFADFIPRVVPSAAFITAMIMSHRHTEEDRQYLAKQAKNVTLGNFGDMGNDMCDPEAGSMSGQRLSDDDIAMNDAIPGRGEMGLSDHGDSIMINTL